MAKSSRSKWKKTHRRQRAADEAKNVERRIRQLNKKLKLTIKGGISAVPPQAPERRFHFLNPELDPRVPNTSKNLNNNYRMELNHVSYDYTKPLTLAPPKTNFYGKSDPDAPHPITVNYETLDADTPVGGHALTREDMARIEAKQQELLALATQLDGGKGGEEEEGVAATYKIQGAKKSHNLRSRRGRKGRKNGEEEEELVNFDNDPALYGDGSGDDEPEAFVLSLDSMKPVKVGSGKKAAASSSPSGKAPVAAKIASMSAQTTKKAKVVATGGNAKVKKMNKDSVKTSRMATSTGKKGKKIIL